MLLPHNANEATALLTKQPGYCEAAIARALEQHVLGYDVIAACGHGCLRRAQLALLFCRVPVHANAHQYLHCTPLWVHVRAAA